MGLQYSVTAGGLVSPIFFAQFYNIVFLLSQLGLGEGVGLLYIDYSSLRASHALIHG